MSNTYPGDPLASNINATISGYSTLGNIGSYNFQINYTTSINISLNMPPSTKTVSNFIMIKASILNFGDIDFCYVSISNTQPNSVVISAASTSLEVQKIANYSLSIFPSSPITSTDSLIISFPLTFNVNAVTSIDFTLGVFGMKNVVKNGSILIVPNLVNNYIQNQNIKFVINQIVNQLDNRPASIIISTMTSDGFLRDESSYSIKMQTGVLTINSFSCNTYQIGYKTPCTLNFTL
jgi:hypothetical protein